MKKVINPNLAAVAELAGVSKATASRVLNQVGPASDETRQRILEAARKIKYVPDAQFQRLGRRAAGGHRSTGNLGLLLSARSEQDFAKDPYYSRLFWGMEREAQAQHFHLVVASAGGREMEYLPPLVLDRHVDGLLIQDGPSPEFIRRIQSVMPVLLVNDMAAGPGISAVMPDESSGIRQAVAHLRALGHDRVTFFDIADNPRRNVHHALREEAFRRLAMEGPEPLRGARVVVLPGREKSLDDTLFEQLTAWRKAGEMPTALLCAADVYAVGFIAMAARLGMAVPRELSVIGVDDTPACDYVRPKLSSVRQPLEAMGAAAVQNLVRRLADPQAEQPAVTHLFDVCLVHRESCARVPPL